MIGPNKLVLHCNLQEKLACDKDSSLFVPFVNYKENEVLQIQCVHFCCNL